MKPETVFEAPGIHEPHYGNPEMEWEAEAYTNPEMEWETEAYSNPEFEWEAPYTNPEMEWETEAYSNPEFEGESYYTSPYAAEGEFEDEGEYLFGGLWKGLKKIGKALTPLAKKFAPRIAGTLVGMIPGIGSVLAPMANKAAGALLREGEAEANQLESQMLVSHEGEMEVSPSETAQQLALTEFLASQAAESESEAEAEAAIAASLPITISIMGGRRALRPVVPILSQANARIVSALRRHGPAGHELLRLLPTIHRQTVGTLRAATRAGQPITAPVALKTLAHVTHKVLSSPRTVAKAIDRNMLVKHRVAPAMPHHRGPIFRGIPNYGRTSTGHPTFRRPAVTHGRHGKTLASSLRYQ